MPIYEKYDSPFWWADYRDAQGRRIRRSTGVPKAGGKTGKEEAEALLGKWKAEVHAEKMWGRAPAPKAPIHTFGDVMMRYFEDRVPNQRAGTRRARATAKALYQHFGGLPIADCDVGHFIRERRAAGWAPGTINKALRMLSAACNHYRGLGWGIPNVAAGHILAEPVGRTRYLEPDEAARLVEAAQSRRAPWLADFIVLALNTGCRAGELLGLEWARVNLRAGEFALEAQHTKAARRRTVPLNGAAREAMLRRARFRAEHCPDSPWVFCKFDGCLVGGVKTGFKLALRRAGIQEFRIHDQRHTFAVGLVDAGVPLPVIRDALGHATTAMTERYAHVRAEHVRDAVNRIGHDLVTDEKRGTKKTTATR